jgi:hypothetical protein
MEIIMKNKKKCNKHHIGVGIFLVYFTKIFRKTHWSVIGILLELSWSFRFLQVQSIIIFVILIIFYTFN